MPNLNLNANDYMAITRALDANRNNRIDKQEATVNWKAHFQIGNRNGVAGTRETAEALARGDVYITNLPADAAEKVAVYFSKHDENLNKQVDKWVSDNFISKEDLPMSDSVRSKMDTNWDNRISRSEFATALATGRVTMGESSW